MSKHLHWAQKLAKETIDKFPKEKLYTCAAGISPSGRIHIGNFRDLITTELVYRALKESGKKARVLFSWDDFDRFRKAPIGVPKSYEKYIGMPLTSVPDPDGNFKSYAERFQKEFESSIKELGIKVDFKYQTKLHKKGTYDQLFKLTLDKRKEIAKILAKFKSQGMSKKEIDNYYPVSVYSNFTGKDNTKVLDYDGNKEITYQCLDTNKKETIDFTKTHIMKLTWRVDWAMRWFYEKVTFEPGGKDHLTVGSSYDAGKLLSKEIFKRPHPVSQKYDFIGIKTSDGKRVSKMSGSKGTLVTPSDLSKIYDPAILRWLFARAKPTQVFDFVFDTELIRQYDEFDREVSRMLNKKLIEDKATALKFSQPSKSYKFLAKPIPFRLAISYGQIIQFNLTKLKTLLKGTGENYDEASLSSRLAQAKSWLQTYNKSQMISLLSQPNKKYFNTLNKTEQSNIKKLAQELAKTSLSIKKLDEIVYSIPKDLKLSQEANKPRQRNFFKHVYQLLIGKDTGPRLSTFLWAVDRKRVLQLLNF